ncbi:Wiskott-Aldrich syndrome protein [Gracilaria domingensis]|nr:Wiskott-Aldrich syndrome protein [Gracilaria domingensis]
MRGRRGGGWAGARGAAAAAGGGAGSWRRMEGGRCARRGARERARARARVYSDAWRRARVLLGEYTARSAGVYVWLAARARRGDAFRAGLACALSSAPAAPPRARAMRARARAAGAMEVVN